MFTQHVKQEFRRVKTQIPRTSASTSATVASAISSTSYGENFSITLHSVSGTMYINSTGTATTNSMQLTAGMSVDLKVSSSLSLVSDSSDAKYQAWIWE